MMGAHVSGVTHCDDEGIVAASVMAGWLHLAAAPTFAIMALLTVVFDSGPPNALCLATGNLRFGGMVTMYLLMGVLHLAPWLKLISRRLKHS
jgi:hypothetical protein